MDTTENGPEKVGNESAGQEPQNQAQNNTVADREVATPEPKKKNSSLKKILIILGCTFAGIILLAVIICLIVFAGSKKFECSSSEGSITVMYGDNTINGYVSNGLSYDYDQQKSYAESIGVEAYLDELKAYFESNTDGICVRK